MKIEGGGGFGDAALACSDTLHKKPIDQPNVYAAAK